MSIATYKITQVSPEVRDVTLDHGGFKSYRFRCEGQGDKVFSLLQKPDSAPPKVGDSFEATVKNVFKNDDGSEVTNLKRVQQQQQGGRRNGHSPEERESIERQVAAKCATDLLVAWMAQPESHTTPEGIIEFHRQFADAIAEGIKR